MPLRPYDKKVLLLAISPEEKRRAVTSHKGKFTFKKPNSPKGGK